MGAGRGPKVGRKGGGEEGGKEREEPPLTTAGARGIPDAGELTRLGGLWASRTPPPPLCDLEQVT